MRQVLATAIYLLVSASVPSFATMTFKDRGSYCRAGIEFSNSTLFAPTQGVPKSETEALMQGMTDPVAIRMVKEVIDFAYSRPAGTSLEAMRTELLNLCLA